MNKRPQNRYTAMGNWVKKGAKCVCVTWVGIHWKHHRKQSSLQPPASFWYPTTGYRVKKSVCNLGIHWKHHPEQNSLPQLLISAPLPRSPGNSWALCGWWSITSFPCYCFVSDTWKGMFDYCDARKLKECIGGEKIVTRQVCISLHWEDVGTTVLQCWNIVEKMSQRHDIKTILKGRWYCYRGNVLSSNDSSVDGSWMILGCWIVSFLQRNVSSNRVL